MCVCACVCACVLLTYHLLTQAVVNRMMYLRCKMFTQVSRFRYSSFLQNAFLSYRFECKSTSWPIMPSGSGDDYLVISLMNIFNATTHFESIVLYLSLQTCVQACTCNCILVYVQWAPIWVIKYSIKLIMAANWMPVYISYRTDDSIVKNIKMYSLCLIVFLSCASHASNLTVIGSPNWDEHQNYCCLLIKKIVFLLICVMDSLVSCRSAGGIMCT